MSFFFSHHPHHAVDDVTGRRLIRLLENALQQEGVLGQPLVGLGHHVGQLQTVTLLMCLSPLKAAETNTGNETFIEAEI